MACPTRRSPIRSPRPRLRRRLRLRGLGNRPGRQRRELRFAHAGDRGVQPLADLRAGRRSCWEKETTERRIHSFRHTLGLAQNEHGVGCEPELDQRCPDRVQADRVDRPSGLLGVAWRAHEPRANASKEPRACAARPAPARSGTRSWTGICWVAFRIPNLKECVRIVATRLVGRQSKVARGGVFLELPAEHPVHEPPVGVESRHLSFSSAFRLPAGRPRALRRFGRRGKDHRFSGSAPAPWDALPRPP